jgi:hypothetical protein
VSGRIAKLAPDSVRLKTPAAIVGVEGPRWRSSSDSNDDRRRAALVIAVLVAGPISACGLGRFAHPNAAGRI